jgi:integrase
MEVNGKRSLRDVKTNWGHLAEFFSGDRISRITTDRFRAYQLARQKEGASNGTINREAAALKRGFKLMMQAGRIASAPHLPMLEEAKPRQGFVEPADFARLHEALPEYLKDFSLVLYRSGWRLSELQRLERRDVDLNAREIHLRPENSKNGQPRTLPLDDAMTEAITRALETGSLACQFVFQREGRPIGDIRKAWATACEATGLRNPDPRHKWILRHDFRRSAVRNLVHAGAPDKVVMEATGHKTRAVLDRYHVTTNSDLRAAMQRQEGYLAEQEEKPGKIIRLRKTG